MNMPGFTAEASLYGGGAHYHTGSMWAGLRQGGEVIPSAVPLIRCACRGRGDNTACTCCWSFGSAGGCTICGSKIGCHTINF